MSKTTAYVYDDSTTELVVEGRLGSHPSPINTLCFSHDGKYLATGDEDGVLVVDIISVGFLVMR